MSRCAKVAIVGSGRLGTEVVKVALGVGQKILGGVVRDPSKAGRDFGILTTGTPLGLAATVDIGEVLAAPGLDAVYYCGLGGAAQLEVFERCAAAGVAAITGAGLAHPETELGPDAAADLNKRAHQGGARLLGTGMSPGFFFDALPSFLATTMPDPVTVRCVRVSDASTWGAGVLQSELKFGSSPSELETGPYIIGYMRQSMRLLADSLGMTLDSVVGGSRPVVSDEPVEAGGIVAQPGTITGGHYVLTGSVDGEVRLTLEWQGLIRPPEANLVISVNGPDGLRSTVTYDAPADVYPSTAARMVKSLRPLLMMPAGLHTPTSVLNLSGSS